MPTFIENILALLLLAPFWALVIVSTARGIPTKIKSLFQVSPQLYRHALKGGHPATFDIFRHSKSGWVCIGSGGGHAAGRLAVFKPDQRRF
ncbi:MAG: hypothetical protein ACXV7J_05370 [Methylomonas sp.]